MNLSEDPCEPTTSHYFLSISECASAPKNNLSSSKLELKSWKFTHTYFNRYEPQSPKRALSILLGAPSLLSVLDAYIARPTAFPGIPLTFLVYFATLVGSAVAYRFSPSHPLAKYPGPFVAKLSKLWMVDLSANLLAMPGLMDVHWSSFPQPGNSTNITRTCTRNTGTSCALVSHSHLQTAL